MAQWDRITSRGNVSDRRGMGPMIMGGGISLTGLALIMLFNYIAGGNFSDVISQLPTVSVENEQPADTSEFAGSDEYEVFSSTVLGSNNDVWEQVFAQNNLSYPEPTLVLFRGATQSACGGANSNVGPHYCPLDQTIYLDETFFEELENRFGAEGGDVAEAYVIAHEVGHHVQNELGTLDQVRNSSGESTNELSINLELQADCYAGVWAYSLRDQGVFAPGEINEAVDAAEAVGDDRIQEKVTGQVNPETWTHGSSEQRVTWFNRGFDSGSAEACNTFTQ